MLLIYCFGTMCYQVAIYQPFTTREECVQQATQIIAKLPQGGTVRHLLCALREGVPA